MSFQSSPSSFLWMFSLLLKELIFLFLFAAKLKIYMYVATTWTLLLELSCLHILYSFVWFFFFFCTKTVWFAHNILWWEKLQRPTTNNLNLTFLLVHNPFFNILKRSQEGSSMLYLHPGSTQALVLLCISAMTKSLQSYVQRRFGWLVGCIIVLRPFDTF